MDCSTPGPWRQAQNGSPEQVLGITPIRGEIDSPDQVNPDVYTDSNLESPRDGGKTNLSNEMRGSILIPRKEETSTEKDQSLAKETLMLERSSVRTGCDVGSSIIDCSKDKIEENWYFSTYPRERTKSLDSLLGDIDLNRLVRRLVLQRTK